MKRKSASRERERHAGQSAAHGDGLIPAPHLHPTGDLESPKLAGDRQTASRLKGEQDALLEQSRRKSAVTDEYPYETTKPSPFVAGCLIACILCAIFWLTLLLSVWYLYK